MSVFVVNGPRPQITKPTLLLIAYVVALALVLALGRAYQMQEVAFLHRLCLWLTICGLIVSQAAIVHAKLLDINVHRWAAIISSLLICSLVLAVQLDLLKMIGFLPKVRDPFFEFWLFLVPPVVVVGGVGLVLLALGANPERVLASKKHSTVLLVQAQEHYLIVTTEDGQELKRARMRDYIQTLAKVAGLQVHRSWWVAEQAVAKVTRQGRDYVLHLKSGGTVPVARSRIEDLRKADWI